MKQLMHLAFVGLLAISSFAHAEGEKPKHKAKAKKAKAKIECPTSCPKTECDKSKCVIMSGCSKMTCNKQ